MQRKAPSFDQKNGDKLDPNMPSLCGGRQKYHEKAHLVTIWPSLQTLCIVPRSQYCEASVLLLRQAVNYVPECRFFEYCSVYSWNLIEQPNQSILSILAWIFHDSDLLNCLFYYHVLKITEKNSHFLSFPFWINIRDSKKKTSAKLSCLS